MTLRIVGAGLGRTGTTSLKQALELLLGGVCHHMTEVASQENGPGVWADAFEGRQQDWAAVMAPYVASVDWPSSPFWAELAETFPDAPILLSVRDPDSWYESAKNTIIPALASQEDADHESDWTRMRRGMTRSFTPHWPEPAAMKAAFVAHNDHVRATAPPGRLVEWTASDGWEPICAALDLPIPTEPFPHSNSSAEFRSRSNGPSASD
jgi:hypothetical protein